MSSTESAARTENKQSLHENNGAAATTMELKATVKIPSLVGHKVDRLLRRMVSPLTGMDKTVAFSLHDPGSPNLYIVVAQLTAVHRLAGFDQPLSYHLSGYGVNREETFMRTLGETTERYSHMVHALQSTVKFKSYTQMQAEGHSLVNADKLRFYMPEQLSKPGVRFKEFDAASPTGWMETMEVWSGKTVWLPAQLLVIGYRPRASDGERWMNMAVSTGTAAHTIPEKALASAIAELIQMDTAMGAWYSGKVAPRIRLDERTPTLSRVLASVAANSAYEMRFHYLANPDLPAHVVTCLLWNRREEIPAAAVGIACDLDLESACYKAFLEASAIPHLCLLGLLQSPQKLNIDPANIADLDMNVVYYGLPQNRHRLLRHFPDNQFVAASELPHYPKVSPKDSFKFLADAFRPNKDLYVVDITARDANQLGFSVQRVYSPDLLTLCYPSLPHKAHARFQAYGGAKHEDPHPYP